MARGRKAGIFVEVKGMDKLTDLEQELVVPLLDIAKQLKADIKARVRRGVNDQGQSFSPLGSHSTPRPGDGLFWVAPNKPQPDGYIVKPSSGQWVGWAGYKTYRDYCSALGKPRTFFESGNLLESLAINVRSESAVRLYFQGSRRTYGPDGKPMSVRNRDIAWANSWQENNPLLMPSDGEMSEVAKLLEDEAARQILPVAAGMRQAKNMRKRADGLQRRVSAMSRGR